MVTRGTPRLLTRLAGLNQTGVFLAIAVVVVGALFAPGAVGAVLLGVLAVALTALLTLTWPLHDPRTRMLRLAVLGLLVVLAATKLMRL
jgi:hypothetical protein